MLCMERSPVCLTTSGVFHGVIQAVVVVRVDRVRECHPQAVNIQLDRRCIAFRSSVAHV